MNDNLKESGAAKESPSGGSTLPALPALSALPTAAETQTYLIRVGELSLKGDNRPFFEHKLKGHIKFRLRRTPSRWTGTQGRFYLTAGKDKAGAVEKVLSSAFGVHSFSRCLKRPKDPEAIVRAAVDLAGEFLPLGSTFKVETRRADKSFPLNSYELACLLGDAIRAAYPGLKARMTAPHWVLHAEIRETAVLFGPPLPGLGGLPVGSAGRGLVLLSGGIDSPVAAWLMAKRGLKVDAVYFHAYPFTSDEAKEKVRALANILSPALGGLNLYVVPWTEAELRIQDRGPENEATLLMRSAMVRTAEALALQKDRGCLITGESLSQVASQTLPALGWTNRAARELPIFRPLIGMDKEEIITLAKKIGTYPVSILPYPDCCAVFSPRHPVTQPKRDRLEESYRNLEIEEILDRAIRDTERIYLPPLGQ